MAVPWNGIHPWTNDVDARGRCAGISATELHQRAGEAEEGLLSQLLLLVREGQRKLKGEGRETKKERGGGHVVGGGACARGGGRGLKDEE